MISLLITLFLSSIVAALVLRVALWFARNRTPECRLRLAWTGLAAATFAIFIPHPLEIPLLLASDGSEISKRVLFFCILTFWALGVAGLGIRFLHGLKVLRGLRMRSRLIYANSIQAPPCLSDTELYSSREIVSPAVCGVNPPFILLPEHHNLGICELQALLLHESAHLRRRDPVWNVLLNFLETVLFFCPGIWWICARIRIERELACDDEAIAITDDPIVYAHALLKLAENKAANPTTVVGAGEHLLIRIQRVLSQDRIKARHDTRLWSTVPALFALLITVCGLVPKISLPSHSEQVQRIVIHQLRSIQSR